MAAAQIALGIEMDNRMKRKAAAMGVFLNVETQKKFMKMASNVQLQTELKLEENTCDIYRNQFEQLHRDFLLKESLCTTLERRNARLERESEMHRNWISVLEKDLCIMRLREEGYDVDDID